MYNLNVTKCNFEQSRYGYFEFENNKRNTNSTAKGHSPMVSCAAHKLFPLPLPCSAI